MLLAKFRSASAAELEAFMFVENQGTIVEEPFKNDIAFLIFIHFSKIFCKFNKIAERLNING